MTPFKGSAKYNFSLQTERNFVNFQILRNFLADVFHENSKFLVYFAVIKSDSRNLFNKLFHGITYIKQQFYILKSTFKNKTKVSHLKVCS